MQISEKQIRNFFTKDNRFIHYCVRKGGYHFINDDDVETTRYFALLNFTKVINSKKEFENEGHIMVLSIAKSTLSEEEYDMLIMHGYHGISYVDIHKKYPHRSLESTRNKVARIKKIIQKNVIQETSIVDRKSTESIMPKVRVKNNDKSDGEKQTEKYNHIKAMHIISFAEEAQDASEEFGGDVWY